MTKEQLDVLIDFIRAAALREAEKLALFNDPYDDSKEELALRRAFTEEPK